MQTGWVQVYQNHYNEQRCSNRVLNFSKLTDIYVPKQRPFFRLDQTFYTSLLAPGSSLISLCQPLDQLVQNKVRNQVGPSTEPLYSQ